MSRSDFVDGLTGLNADSTAKIKALFAQLTSSLATNNNQYKDFYRWVFTYFLGKDRKTLDKEQALELWEMVLAGGHFSQLDKFLAFISQDEETKFVNKDLWDQVYDFAVEIKPDLSNWEDDGAWPIALDDFVQSQKAATGGNWRADFYFLRQAKLTLARNRMQPKKWHFITTVFRNGLTQNHHNGYN